MRCPVNGSGQKARNTFLSKKQRMTLFVFAAAVVFAVTYLLVLPAFTLDEEEAIEQGGIDVPAAAEQQDKEELQDTEDTQEEAAKAEEPQGELAFEGDGYNIALDADAKAGLPEGTQVSAEEVTSDAEDYDAWCDEALKALQEAGQAGENTVISSARFYDISLLADGEAIEPQSAVNVKISYDKAIRMKNSEGLHVVHFAADKNGNLQPEVLDEDNVDINAKDGSGSVKVSDVAFQAAGFSMYGIVGTEIITEPFVAGDGSTYEVTVAYGPEAGIPEGSTLEVSELTEDSEGYQDYMEQTAKAVKTDSDALDYLKILDISIMNGDEKVDIQAPVDVQIKLLDKEDAGAKAGDHTKVIHFGEDSTDVIDPDIEGTTLNFETDGFSYYAVTSYGATTNLDGKSYAIVQVNTQSTQDPATGNNTVYAGRALNTTAQNNNTRLGGTTVNVETHEGGLNIVTDGDTEVVKWTFEAAEGNNTYYVKSPDGRYLNLNGNNSLILSNTQQALTVTADGNRVRISNGNRRVQSSVRANASRSASNNQYFYNGDSSEANYVYMTLCEIEEFDPNAYPTYQAEKVSVQDLVDGQEYIIYKNIYNENTGQYEDWVIDCYGNPVRAYDQGDSLSLHSEHSPMWKVSILTNSLGQPTGYYLFVNEETGMMLHPMADGTLVKEFDPDTSPTTDGVALKGRENGKYVSTIEYWDGSAMAWYGYEFTSEGKVKLQSATGADSMQLSFAGKMPSGTGLHEVSTVDSAANGITIHMFNYPDRNTIASVTGSDGYGVGVLPAQHVRPTLVDGYPFYTNGRSGSALFNPANNHHQGTGNHLFLENVYDSTGYYEYSAFNNFAHYNKNNGTFTVYEETGTPSPTASNFYFKRGNFFPYNNLNTNNTAQNIYTGDGKLIDYENPSYGQNLYGLSGNTDFYFGMTMEFNFLMPKDGYEDGSPLIYEFNGDDDLWIYVDDVLILDIGGVHDAFPGSINFATGEITGGNGGANGARTIKDCFKNAGVFPDGTPWDDSKVDQYFNGNTFISYGNHKFNMFYMEHGAGASNLKMRFNLPVIEKGKVAVAKQLDNTSQENFANVAFAYQAFAKDGTGEYQPMTSAVYEGTTNPVTFYDDVEINGKRYDNVFYLKPGQAAIFSDMIEDELYYVQELGIDTDYYDKIYVNDVQIVGEQVIIEDGIYKSTEATPRNRARVTYTNHCNELNSNELRITKRLAEGSEDNGDTFEFRVMLERSSADNPSSLDPDGVLANYYQGTYYIQDDNGVFYRFEGGRLVPNGHTPYACTAGNNGTIARIPPNYTVVIKDLLAGTDFYVDEIRVRPNGSSSDVLVKDSEWMLVSTNVTNADPSEIDDASIWDYEKEKYITGSSIGSIALGKDAQVTITNKRKAADVQLKKVKEDGTTTIAGSGFDLDKYVNGSWMSVSTDIEPGAPATATTPAVSNPADLGALPVGKYRLTETKAPDGYIILENKIYFEIYENPKGTFIGRFIDENGDPLSEAEIEELSSIVTLANATSGDETVCTITVINTPGAELPSSGGPGTTWIYLIGSILLLGCGITLIARRRIRA